MKKEEKIVKNYSTQIFFEGPVDPKNLREALNKINEIVGGKQDVVFLEDKNITLKQDVDVYVFED